MKGAFTYILTNKYNKVFYIGVTSNLIARVFQHKEKIGEGFTVKYNVDKLVYYEEYADIRRAIEREKQLKNWHRKWKIDLIRKSNPKWDDLSKDFILMR